jgi:hypothetical protein
MKEHRYDVQIHAPKLELKGDYEINGRFLLLPLTGKGKFEMTFRKYTYVYCSVTCCSDNSINIASFL